MPPGQGSRFFKVISCRFIIDPFEHLVVCQSLQNLIHIIICTVYIQVAMRLFLHLPKNKCITYLLRCKDIMFHPRQVPDPGPCPGRRENPRSIGNPRSSVSTRRYRQLHLHHHPVCLWAGWSLNGCWVQWSSFFSLKKGHLFLWLTTCLTKTLKKA